MKPRGTSRRVATGIYQDAIGYRVLAFHRGHMIERRYHSDTTLPALQKHRATLTAWLREHHGDAPKAITTCAEDVEVYLKAVSVRLDFPKDRAREIQAWLPFFGDRRRSTITTPEIDRILEGWKRAGYAVSTIKHRMYALSNLYRVLDGRSAPNPVRDAVRFKPDRHQPRARDRAELATVLDALTPGTKTKARLQLMHWTGMRASQAARLRPESFRLTDAIPHVIVPRGKSGTLARVPLTPEGVAAARSFLTLEAWRDQDTAASWTGSANRLIANAAKKLKIRPFTAHVLRHSLAAALRRQGLPLPDIQHLLGHLDWTTTEMYAPPVSAQHAEALEALRGAPGAKQGAKAFAPPSRVTRGRMIQKGQQTRKIKGKRRRKTV